MLTTNTQMTEELDLVFREKVLPLGKVSAVVTMKHAADEVPRVRGFSVVHEAVRDYGSQINLALYPFSDIKAVVCFIKADADSDEVKHVFSAGPFKPVGESDLTNPVDNYKPKPRHADEETLDEEDV